MSQVAFLEPQTELEFACPEPLITLTALSGRIGVPLFAIRRAAKQREFPVYYVGNRRARVRLSEVLTSIAVQDGGN